MNLTARLAYSQLKINRKRTIWTLIGIILSTALIMTVCSLVASGSNSVVMLAGDPAQQGMLFVVLLIPAIILSIIIILMSVIVISNGFRVSAGERTAQFGILKSTGATKRQIASTVMHESILLSLVGIPIGIVAGLALGYIGVEVANHFLVDLNNLTQIMIQELYIFINFVITWQSIAIAIIISFVTILISAWKPASKASKISAIGGIRGTHEVKIMAKQLRINPLIKKLFGFEGVLAAKSLKRSKRNFRASTVSLTIAVILFVTAGGIERIVSQLEELMFPDIDATVIVDYVSSRDRQNPETGTWERYVVAPIDSRVADIITERFREYNNTHIFGIGGNAESYHAVIPREMITPQAMEIAARNFPQHQYEYELRVNIITIDPNNYARLSELAGVPLGSNILLNHFAINDRGDVVIFEPFQFERQNIQLIHQNGNFREVQIHGVLTADELPPELFPTNPAAAVAVSLIVPYGDMREYTWLATPNDINEFMAYANLVMNEMFPRDDEDTCMGLGFTTRVFETGDFVRVMNLGISIAAVFVYSFTALLTLIGLTSVISTISTNVRMRSREFAILKSVGMTQSGLKHTLNLESIMCSSKSILFGLPIAMTIIYLIYLPIRSMFSINYETPWLVIMGCVVAVFAITWLTMRFTVSRIRNVNIVESIRSESGA